MTVKLPYIYEETYIHVGSVYLMDLDPDRDTFTISSTDISNYQAGRDSYLTEF